MNKLTVSIYVLMASMALSGLVQADSVKVRNRSGIDVVVETFNGDDSVCLAHYDTWPVSSGEDKTLSCNFGSTTRCKLLVSDAADNQRPTLCGSSTAAHTCGSSKVVYVLNKQTLIIHGDGCWFPTADAEVRITRGQLPVPGGGGVFSDCLWATQAGTLASNSRSNLEWQSDGNLVVYSGGSAIWASNSVGNADRLCFQGDGNLVTYKNGLPTWSTGTQNSGQTLKLQTDCNLAIYDSGENYKWGSQAFCT